jgi:segregation and condensation protein B
MSLKAKIEAVIYASEEPVTLAQLTGLLGEEGQVELDTLAAQQHSLALEAEAEAEPATGDDDPAPSEDADAQSIEATAAEAEPAAVPSEAVEAAEPEQPASPDAPQTPDAKAIAAATRLRDAEQKIAARKLREHFRIILDELIADYANGDRGLEIREVAGGFRLATKPEYHDAVRGFVKSLKPPLKLSLQALETLAVVAYKQPVTAPEVSEIRGVESAGTLGSLLTRKLVTTAGRKQVIGRPILYKTTKDFLLRFGLKDINELPSIEEFEKMAGELNDAIQEEIPMEAEGTEAAEISEATEVAEASSTDGPDGFVASDDDPIELEGHNLQPIESDAPTSEPESISPAGETDSDA